jgi:hypothetical protein
MCRYGIRRNGGRTLSSSDFQWDEQGDEYCCPQGHVPRREWRAFTNPRSHVTNADTIIYRSIRPLALIQFP